MKLADFLNKNKPGGGISGVEGVSDAARRPWNHPEDVKAQAEDEATKRSVLEGIRPLSGKEIAYALGTLATVAVAVVAGTRIGNGFQEKPGLNGNDEPDTIMRQVEMDQINKNQLPPNWDSVVEVPTPAGQNPESAPGGK